MDGAYVGLEHGLPPHDDVLVDLRARLVIGLFDPRRMDATVLKQTFEGQTRDLPTYPVEAREQHGARGVVDDEVDSGERLEGTDVAALASDDAAFELVRLELDDGHGGLHRVAGRHALHHRRQDAAGPPVRVMPGLLLNLADESRALVTQIVLELAHEDLLGLARAQPGHPFELAHLPALRLFELLARVIEVAAAVLKRTLPLGELLAERLEGCVPGVQPLLRRAISARRASSSSSRPSRRPPAGAPPPPPSRGRPPWPRRRPEPRGGAARASPPRLRLRPQPAPPTAPPTGCPFPMSSHPAQRAGLSLSWGERCGAAAARHRLSPGAKRAPGGARRLRLWTLSNAPFERSAGACQDCGHEIIRRFARLLSHGGRAGRVHMRVTLGDPARNRRRALPGRLSGS